MNDEVNNPSHYNQNGIEVIDVIETYAKDDFRLANVLKYVCRSGYKGNKLQDLQKAAWYLNRVIEELALDPARCDFAKDEDDLERVYSVEQVEAFFDGYDFAKDEDESYVQPSPDRIAGDDDAARRIKDGYYEFDRYEIVGHCFHCYAELPADKPRILSCRDTGMYYFCSALCQEMFYS